MENSRFSRFKFTPRPPPPPPKDDIYQRPNPSQRSLALPPAIDPPASPLSPTAQYALRRANSPSPSPFSAVENNYVAPNNAMNYSTPSLLSPSVEGIPGSRQTTATKKDKALAFLKFPKRSPRTPPAAPAGTSSSAPASSVLVIGNPVNGVDDDLTPPPQEDAGISMPWNFQVRFVLLLSTVFSLFHSTISTSTRATSACRRRGRLHSHPQASPRRRLRPSRPVAPLACARPRICATSTTTARRAPPPPPSHRVCPCSPIRYHARRHSTASRRPPPTLNPPRHLVRPSQTSTHRHLIIHHLWLLRPHLRPCRRESRPHGASRHHRARRIWSRRGKGRTRQARRRSRLWHIVKNILAAREFPLSAFSFLPCSFVLCAVRPGVYEALRGLWPGKRVDLWRILSNGSLACFTPPALAHEHLSGLAAAPVGSARFGLSPWRCFRCGPFGACLIFLFDFRNLLDLIPSCAAGDFHLSRSFGFLCVPGSGPQRVSFHPACEYARRSLGAPALWFFFLCSWNCCLPCCGNTLFITLFYSSLSPLLRPLLCGCLLSAFLVLSNVVDLHHFLLCDIHIPFYFSP